jgi:hypothetical protein
MGTLKPGATYIYENVDGDIYAREFGESERTLIGTDQNGIRARLREQQLWHDILAAAKTNPALQDALDRAIIIYELGKKNG